MSNNIFDPKSIFGGSSSDLKRYWDIGTTMGKGIGAWSLKRRLMDQGYDAITIDAAIAAHKDGRDYQAVLQHAEQAAALKQQQEHMRTSPPPVHGSARFASLDELQTANLIGPNTGRGLSLGNVNNQSLTWDGESHLLTVAPTRTGKGTMQIVPNLLQYKGSAIVLDPKGELHAATAKWRQENVGPVYVLNPFGADGLGNQTHSFNPLDGVTDSIAASKLAETIFPRGDNPQTEFFDNEAIGFLAATIEFTARFMQGEDRTLGAIRDDAAALTPQFHAMINAMADPAMPNSIRNAANNFKTKSRDTGQPRVLDSLNQHLRIWDSQGLRRCTATSDFNFADLKDQTATVYLILPFEEISAFSTFVRMIFATALNAMLENRTIPQIPVLFVMDEFLALDPDERFVAALRTHAGAGVRLWFFLQDLPTLEQKYPKTWKSFLQVETKTFFGTDDIHTAKLVSEYLGDRTVAYDIPSITGSTSGGNNGSSSYSIANNLHLSNRNLMTHDEVISFMAGNAQGRSALHFLRNVKPVQAKLSPWFTSPLKSRV